MSQLADTNLSVNRIEDAYHARAVIEDCRDIIDCASDLLDQEDDSNDTIDLARPGLIKAIQLAVYRMDVAWEALGHHAGWEKTGIPSERLEATD